MNYKRKLYQFTRCVSVHDLTQTADVQRIKEIARKAAAYEFKMKRVVRKRERAQWWNGNATWFYRITYAACGVVMDECDVMQDWEWGYVQQHMQRHPGFVLHTFAATRGTHHE